MKTDITRQVRLAWELYAVKEISMSAGEALAEFDRWLDSVSAEPSDAAVDAAWRVIDTRDARQITHDDMRAALRAAAEAASGA